MTSALYLPLVGPLSFWCASFAILFTYCFDLTYRDNYFLDLAQIDIAQSRSEDEQLPGLLYEADMGQKVCFSVCNVM